MVVNTTWSSPATAGGSGGIDLAAGDTLSETVWDRTASDLYRLGGTDGNAKTGALQIGATQTFSNGFMSQGLTINQSAFDNEILTLKSSDVAHGVTSTTETDTFAYWQKNHATNGGVLWRGLTAATAALVLDGIETTDDTTKSLSGLAPFFVQGSKKSGTTVTALGANANIAAFSNATVGTRFILDADGEGHCDVGTAWVNFDHDDDTAMLNSLAHEVSRPGDPIKDEFRDWLTYNRAALEKAQLVTFNSDGHHFVNMNKLAQLHTGAIRQLALRCQRLEAEVVAMRGALPDGA